MTSDKDKLAEVRRELDFLSGGDGRQAWKDRVFAILDRPDERGDGDEAQREAVKVHRTVAMMLGWENLPPARVVEQDIRALKARAAANQPPAPTPGDDTMALRFDQLPQPPAVPYDILENLRAKLAEGHQAQTHAFVGTRGHHAFSCRDGCDGYYRERCHAPGCAQPKSAPCHGKEGK
jgi:hypothetical protein